MRAGEWGWLAQTGRAGQTSCPRYPPAWESPPSTRKPGSSRLLPAKCPPARGAGVVGSNSETGRGAPAARRNPRRRRPRPGLNCSQGNGLGKRARKGLSGAPPDNTRQRRRLHKSGIRFESMFGADPDRRPRVRRSGFSISRRAYMPRTRKKRSEASTGTVTSPGFGPGTRVHGPLTVGACSNTPPRPPQRMVMPSGPASGTSRR